MRPSPRPISPAAAGRPARAVVASLFLGVLLASSARAAWQPDGVALSPQPPDFSQQYFLRGLLADGAGGAYVTWLSSFSIPQADQTNFALVAQRVDVLGNRPAPWTAAGSTIFSWISSPSNFGITNAEPVALVPDGSGGAIHALVSASLAVEPHNNFNLHHVLPNATITGFPGYTGDFAGGATFETAVDADGVGGVIQIGVGQTFAPPPGPPPPSPLFARRIDPAGVSLWNVDNIIPPGPIFRGLSALSDGEGGGWFAWTDTREPGDPDVYVLRIDDTGAPAPGFFAGGQLVCGAAGDQLDTHLAPDGLGGVFVEWLDRRDGNDHVYASHVQPAGGLVPGIPLDGEQIPAAGTSDAFVNLASDGQGGLHLVSADGLAHLHRLDSNLQAHAGWPANGIQLNSLPAAAGAVGLAADGAGGAYVSFRNGFGSAAPQGLYAQHFAGDGSFAPGWTAAGVRLSGTGFTSKLVRSGAGAIVAWDDGRSGWPGVYAQRLVTDGPVATELALVASSVSTDGVVLQWYAGDGAGLAVTIERRTADSDWSPRLATACDGTGLLKYADTDVVAGTRYGYRVTWSEGGVERASGETWLTVPAAITALALESPFPNPSSGLATVALSLPDARPARLEIVDLAGRRVAQRELALGAGRHVLRLEEARGLAPGLYLVRLTRGDDTRVARLLRTN